MVTIQDLLNGCAEDARGLEMGLLRRAKDSLAVLRVVAQNNALLQPARAKAYENLVHDDLIPEEIQKKLLALLAEAAPASHPIAARDAQAVDEEVLEFARVNACCGPPINWNREDKKFARAIAATTRQGAETNPAHYYVVGGIPFRPEGPVWATLDPACLDPTMYAAMTSEQLVETFALSPTRAPYKCALYSLNEEPRVPTAIDQLASENASSVAQFDLNDRCTSAEGVRFGLTSGGHAECVHRVAAVRDASWGAMR